MSAGFAVLRLVKAVKPLSTVKQYDIVQLAQRCINNGEPYANIIYKCQQRIPGKTKRYMATISLLARTGRLHDRRTKV